MGVHGRLTACGHFRPLHPPEAALPRSRLANTADCKPLVPQHSPLLKRKLWRRATVGSRNVLLTLPSDSLRRRAVVGFCPAALRFLFLEHRFWWICQLRSINMDLIDDRASLGEDEDDESFDEETGEAKTKSNGANGRFDDSSEEEDDDDDEEAAAEVSFSV